MESLVESIYAPLAGVVADVRVNEGTKVASGEMILTIKGEGFEKVITHYKGGIISQICVSNGTRVKQGDLIATITSADNQSSTAEKTSPTNSNNSTGYVSSFEKQKKNSTVAALLATFLGQFGAHDFYAGRTLCGVAKIVMYFASLFL